MRALADEIIALAEELKNPGDDDEEVLETFSALIEKTTEFRNYQEKRIKFASPAKKKILRLQLVDLDNQLTQFKHGFRKFEAKCNKEKQVKAEEEEKLDKLLDEGNLQVAKMYIIAKHQMPKDFFEGLERSIVDNLPPELVDEFYERIAHLEATQLEDILAGK